MNATELEEQPARFFDKVETYDNTTKYKCLQCDFEYIVEHRDVVDMMPGWAEGITANRLLFHVSDVHKGKTNG